MVLLKLKNLIEKRNADRRRSSKGTSLVEVIVCFALLGIFMACAAVLIANITNIYYRVKGETYSRQVSDILIEKIESEIDGAIFKSKDPEINSTHDAIELYNKTDTHISIYMQNKKIIIHYHDIIIRENGEIVDDQSLDASDWYFADSVYNNFTVEELKFVRGGDTSASIPTQYGLTDVNMGDYGHNVVLVLLKLNSDRYGDYYFHRFIKMYNVPEEEPSAAP